MTDRLTRRRPVRSWGYQVAVVGLAALAGVGAAGCGSTAAPGDGPGAAVGPPAAATSGDQAGALCAVRSRVTRLTVVRHAVPAVPPVTKGRESVPPLHFPFPARVSVTSAAKARAVAAAICALPAMPSGVVVCPAQFPGTTYRLWFTEAGRRLPVVTAQATGCEVVHGAGKVRRASTSPAFWTSLAEAMQLYRPRPNAFQGQGPSLHECQLRSNGGTRLSGCPPLPRISAPVPVN